MKHTLLILASISLVACSKGDPLQDLTAGSFASPPETMTIVIHNYRPQSGAAFQNLFVSNFSVKAEQGQLWPSTARDGMTDALKQTLAPVYGFTISTPESAVLDFADLLLFDMSIISSEQNLMHCGGNQLLSTSNDAFVYNDDRLMGQQQFLGLRDCEKVYMGLNPTLFDNAGNGIPDYMKFRCGLSLTDKNEAFISTAGDGVANIDKCKRNIPINESASTQPNQLFAYHYATQLNSNGSSDFTISNIPIINGGAENFIAFYVTETGTSGTQPGVYTAFAIIKAGYAGKTLNMNYWATSLATYFDQEILVP